MTIQSKYDGTCKQKPLHEWKAGSQIYYSKSPYAICSDEACFNKQKGTTSADQTTLNQAKVTRTTQEREADLGAFIATMANAQIAVSSEAAATVWCRQ